MRYDEITQVVTASKPEDWEVIDVGSGPLYLERHGEVSNGSGQLWVEVDSHYYLAVYKPDVSLRIAWGIRVGDKWESVEDRWIWPDRSMERFAVDAFWHGALVARWALLSVDGGNCYLPDADRATVQTDDSTKGYQTVAWTAKASDIALARLVDRLTRSISQFDRFLEQTGIVEVPDE